MHKIFFSVIILFLSGCSSIGDIASQDKSKFAQTYQIVAGDQLIIRSVTSAQECPSITWDNQTKQQLQLRVGPQLIPLRKKADGVPSDFPVRTCEITWPKNVSSAVINQQTIYPLKTEINTVFILADTGCRLKAADNAYQDCNDNNKWPFEKIVKAAAQFKPDVVIHIGDIHYRESPCPLGQEGCKNSPWGYGFDTWKADFFDPAKKLLDTTPWIFVRGNHESCQRAGQGWQRFIDPLPWTEARSCNDPKNDDIGNYSSPFAVSLGKAAQFIVFDSANIPSKNLDADSFAYKTYAKQIQQADQIASQKSFNIFANHHPISIVVPVKGKSGQNELILRQNSLTSVMQTFHQDQLLSTSFNATLHGHIHTAQAIEYQLNRPVSLISGNGGSALEFDTKQSIAPTAKQKSDLKVNYFQSYLDFGFATLTRHDPTGLSWLYTAYDVNSKLIFQCLLGRRGNQATCTPLQN
jgi:Calcineurin-like phosphoesterase